MGTAFAHLLHRGFPDLDCQSRTAGSVFPRLRDPAPIRPRRCGSPLWLIGLNIALSFPLSLFDGILWGFQRFDVLNAIDVPVSVYGPCSHSW